MKNIILLFLALITFDLYSQNIGTATIKWKAVSTFNATTGETTQENTSIVSYPDHIDWINADGSVKYTLTLLETNGAWTNINNHGQIAFEIDRSGNRGTVLFKKDGTGILVRVMLMMKDTPELFELTISNTELL